MLDSFAAPTGAEDRSLQMTVPDPRDLAQGAHEKLHRQPLAPLRSDFALSMHTPEQLDRLATAAFAILERTGVKVLSPDTLRLLAERGAVVDGARETARLPAELISRALATAPRSFWFGSRDGSCDLDLSGFSYGTTIAA
jgi:trimethylamine:corrinoid methyltransferase-like protein